MNSRRRFFEDHFQRAPVPEWPGLSMSYVDLSSACMDAYDMSGIEFDGARFIDAKARRAHFEGAKLRYVHARDGLFEKI